MSTQPINKGLGKGLTALFGQETAESMVTKNGFEMLDVTSIEPNRNQPRKSFDDSAMKELQESIAMHGVLSPITVRWVGEYYQIIAGERRYRAARAAGAIKIPAVIIDADDKKVMEIALIENLQRQDLNPIEQAMGFRGLMDEFELTQDEVAHRVGKSRPAIANSLRLLALSKEIIELIKDGQLSSGHARALLAIEDHDTRLDVAQVIIRDDLSVRQTEALVKKLSKCKKTDKPSPDWVEVDYAKRLAEYIEQRLGRRVIITYGKSKGKIELEYYGDEDLESLSRALSEIRV